MFTSMNFRYLHLYHIFLRLFYVKYQIEAIVQDATAQGSISNIHALNLRLENQV